MVHYSKYMYDLICFMFIHRVCFIECMHVVLSFPLDVVLTYSNFDSFIRLGFTVFVAHGLDSLSGFCICGHGILNDNYQIWLNAMNPDCQ